MGTLNNTSYYSVLITLFGILLLSLKVSAQKSPTYISAEAGGNGLAASFSFAKPIVQHPNYDIVFQWGIGWTPQYAKSAYPINLPSQLYWKYGRKTLAFEAGVGSSIIFQTQVEDPNYRSNEYYLSPLFGIRHESRKWFIRAFGCPLFHISGPDSSDQITEESISLGISLGLIL